MSRVSIAGHSLGAHIAGLTGKRVQTVGRRIQAIWGLGTFIYYELLRRPWLI